METVDDDLLAARADLYGLFAVAFAFPDEELACALADGRFCADLVAVAGDLGCEDAVQGVTCGGGDAEALFVQMRRDYSRLYLEPGKLRKIYPQESAFKFAEAGYKGMPTLIVTKDATDVELFMRRADLLPDDHARQPVDSIDRELSFVSALLTRALEARMAGDDERCEAWTALAAEFNERHLGTWVDAFMVRTEELDDSGIYGGLARVYRQMAKEVSL